MCTIVGKRLMVKKGCDWRTELDMFSHDCDINPQSHLLLANHIVKHDVLCEYLNMYGEKPYFIEERSYSEVYRLTTNNICPGSIQTNRKYCSAILTILTLWVDSLNTSGLILHNSSISDEPQQHNASFFTIKLAPSLLFMWYVCTTCQARHITDPLPTHNTLKQLHQTFILQTERAGHTDTIMRDLLVFTSVTAFTRSQQICHDP